MVNEYDCDDCGNPCENESGKFICYPCHIIYYLEK